MSVGMSRSQSGSSGGSMNFYGADPKGDPRNLPPKRWSRIKRRLARRGKALRDEAKN